MSNLKLVYYVVGFLFDAERKHVALIHKNRPQWQHGLWNGIGGKMELREQPMDAMRREFQEETGVFIHDWVRFCQLTDQKTFDVTFYFAASDDVWKVKTWTDEEVYVFKVDDLIPGGVKIIPNLQWLIPMAQSWKNNICACYLIKEEPYPLENLKGVLK